MATSLRSGREHRRRSLRLIDSAVAQSRSARRQGGAALATSVLTHQIAAARLGERSVAAALAEQGIDAPAQARLNLRAFTTDTNLMLRLIEQTSTELAFARIVSTLVADAGNSAEGAAIATRPKVGWVRQVVPPCCKRCAVLAGKFYRWSDGFERHPNCRCTHIATTQGAASGLVMSVGALVAQGLVSDLTGAEAEAIALGADVNQVIDLRVMDAGLTTSGRVLRRRGRLTPEGVFAASEGDRDRAVELLRENGYLLGRSTTPSPAPGAAGGSGSGSQPPAPPLAPTPPPSPGDDWAARQAALNLDTHGERLEPHEIEFYERFARRGEVVSLIKNAPSAPTSDFEWRGMQVELKSTKAKYSTIRGRIEDSVRSAANHRWQPMAKDNFVIDLGRAELTPQLREELAGYNQGRRKWRIRRLFVMSQDGDRFEEIPLAK